MDNQILQDLQLFGLDGNVTVKELQTRWRYLSSHTHPDRFRKGTPEFDVALVKQTRLNCAKDRLTAYIVLRDAEKTAYANCSETVWTDSTTENEPESGEPVQQVEIPHIRTTEDERAEKEWTLNISSGFVDELSSVGIFLGAMFVGVTVACAVSAALPFIAINAPVILIAVMLVTMFGVLAKMHKWSRQWTQPCEANGEIHDAK